jgi:hypothetical protein
MRIDGTRRVRVAPPHRTRLRRFFALKFQKPNAIEEISNAKIDHVAVCDGDIRQW